MRSGDSSELGLERFQSPGRGRGLRALRRFAVGELLFSCPAYTCVLTVNERGNHCECCFARYRPAAGPIREGEGRARGAGSASAAWARGFPAGPSTDWSLALGTAQSFRVVALRWRKMGGGVKKKLAVVVCTLNSTSPSPS